MKEDTLVRKAGTTHWFKATEVAELKALTSVTIRKNVTSIDYMAFVDCCSLSSVKIPNRVTTIGVWAFKGCTGLTSVNIPDSVTTIGYGAFKDCI